MIDQDTEGGIRFKNRECLVPPGGNHEIGEDAGVKKKRSGSEAEIKWLEHLKTPRRAKAIGPAENGGNG